MKGKVRKFHFKFGWDIGKYEKWFYDMSEKGLHLKKLGKIFATFEKGDESAKLYRIYISEDKLSPNILENIKNKGWEFITSNGDFQIFSAPIYYNVTEIYDNPQEYSNRLIDKEKSLKNSIILSLVLTIIFIFLIFIAISSCTTKVLALIRWQVTLQLLVGVVALINFLKLIRNYRTIHKVRKSLTRGNSINHREPWKKARYINGFFSILAITINLAIIIVYSVQIFVDFYDGMDDAKRDFPIVTLSEIEQKSDFEDREYYEWSILAPAQLTIYENGSLNNENVGENNSNNTLENKYSSYMQTEYYKLTFRKMANGLIQEMICDAGCKPKRTKGTNFDQIYIYEIGVKKEVFACWKNNVIHIKYYGEKDVDQIVSILSEKTYRY